MYLQASVSYLDDAENEGDARDMANGMSENKVEGSPAANAAPAFDAGYRPASNMTVDPPILPMPSTEIDDT